MPNDYFQFKQFIIRQDKTAMKVTTDACLFGGWIAASWQKAAEKSNPSHILDIGTGTGLLALMLAQKTNAFIEAIEIDENAANQAMENIGVTAWSDNIHIIHADVKDFQFEKKFDLVISNPPFYEHDLKSPVPARNKAMHDTALTLEELAGIVNRLLVQAGHFALLLPYHRMQYFTGIAEANRLILMEALVVKPTPKHLPTRTLMLFKKAGEVEENIEPLIKELVIKEVHHSYTDDFIYYLQDYYLSL